MSMAPGKQPEVPSEERAQAKPPPGGGAFLLVLALFALVAFRLHALQPDAEGLGKTSGFSISRATKDLERLTAAPRPPGTKGHDDARDLLLEELREIGLEAEVQRATAVSTRWGVPYDAARVENIVARLPGSEKGKTLALVAHYDSVPTSKGAADDASGVVTLLETARALREGPTPRNDVLFLFTDAEEAGVLGARAFAAEHPFFKDIALALNFDARGTGGPVVLAETSEGAGALVRTLGKTAPFPLASSFFPVVTRRLGHETDLRPFLNAGKGGMNFAFADGSAHYHAETDVPHELDLGSLAHEGSYALPLAKALSNTNLEAVAKEEVTSFDVPRMGLFVYPRSYDLALAISAVLLFAAALVVSIRKEKARLGRALLGFGAAIVPLVVAPLLSWITVNLLRSLSPAIGAFRGDPTYPTAPRLALVALTLGTTAVAYSYFKKRLSADELSLGALFPWLLLSLGTAFFLPGASYAFTIPLASYLALRLASERLPPSEPDKPHRASLLLLFLSLLPALVLTVPLPYLFFVALGLPRSLPAVFFVALLALPLGPAIDRIAPRERHKAAGAVFFVLFFVALVSTQALNKISAFQPRPASLSYTLDADTQKASWISTDKDLDPFIAAHAPEKAKDALRFGLDSQGDITREGPAPLLREEKPSLDLLSDTTNGDKRTLRFRLRSNRKAPFLLVTVKGATIFGATIDGKRVDESSPFHPTEGEPWGFTFQGAPPEGIEWSLDASPGAALSLRVVDRTYSLPTQLLRSPLPPELTMMPFRIAGSTFVGASFSY